MAGMGLWVCIALAGACGKPGTGSGLNRQAGPLGSSRGNVGEGKGIELSERDPAVLEPRILPADGINEGDPVPAGDSHRTPDALISEPDQGSFNNPIQLTSKKPKFLVWNGAVGPRRIVDVYYVYVKRDALNHPLRSTERRPAYRDKASGRWYLPLLDVVGGDPQKADPADMYWVTLEVHFETGAVQDYKIGFRAVGVMPAVEVSSLPLNGISGDPRSALASARGNGWVVERTLLSHVNGRPARIWKRSGSLEGITFARLDKTIQWIERTRCFRVDYLSRNEQYAIRTRYTLGGYRLIKREPLEGKPGEFNEVLIKEFPKTAENWISWEIKPGESWVLETVAKADLEQASCQVPAPENRLVEVPRFMRCGNDENDRFAGQIVTLTDTWALSGLQITGTSQSEIRVAGMEVAESELDLPDEEGIKNRLLQTGKTEWAQSNTSFNGAALPVVCNGLL